MRYAGIMKAGFYPTPTSVVLALKKILRFKPGARVLDNCCGEGSALQLVTSGTKAETYGIEYDPERMKQASKYLNEVMCCDTLSEAVISHKGFSMLWLNPPYDWDDGDIDQEKERTEITFLKKTHHHIQDGGVLVYIIPFASIKKVKQALCNRLENLRVYPFCEMDYMQYKQAVVIGTYRFGGVSDETKELNKEYLETVLAVPVAEAPEKLPVVDSKEFRGIIYEVPEARIPKEFLIFRSSKFDIDKAYQIIQSDGVMERFEVVTQPKDVKSMHPLTLLRDGHTSMLILGGYMNGEIVKGDLVGIINGIVGKESKITEVIVNEESSTVKETERFKQSILYLDLRNAELLEIQ